MKKMLLNDGRTESGWRSSSALPVGRKNHAVIILDGGPKTISMIVNGQFDDGGESRQFGFGLFHKFFQSPNGAELRVRDGVKGHMLYRRALLTRVS
jgi:hypothetical protein